MIGQLLTIQKPDKSGIQIPTVQWDQGQYAEFLLKVAPTNMIFVSKWDSLTKIRINKPLAELNYEGVDISIQVGGAGEGQFFGMKI